MPDDSCTVKLASVYNRLYLSRAFPMKKQGRWGEKSWIQQWIPTTVNHCWSTRGTCSGCLTTQDGDTSTSLAALSLWASATAIRKCGKVSQWIKGGIHKGLNAPSILQSHLRVPLWAGLHGHEQDCVVALPILKIRRIYHFLLIWDLTVLSM